MLSKEDSIRFGSSEQRIMAEQLQNIREDQTNRRKATKHIQVKEGSIRKVKPKKKSESTWTDKVLWMLWRGQL